MFAIASSRILICVPLIAIGNSAIIGAISVSQAEELSVAIPLPSYLDADGFKCVWSDEFDKDGKPNPDKWGFEHGLVRNKEDQFYQSENARVESGNLVIEGRRELKPLPPNQRRWGRTQAEYTSACLITREKFEWQYGLLEVRAKIQTKPGLWPAIWTLGSARGWPGCGEVDLMEYYDHSILANAVVAGANRLQNWDSTKLPMNKIGGADWDQSFHVWQMLWDKDRINLYLDGELLNEIDVEEMKNATSDGAHPFREPHFLLLNLAIGGTRGGDPSKTEFPSQYLIDYVRVFQQQN